MLNPKSGKSFYLFRSQFCTQFPCNVLKLESAESFVNINFCASSLRDRSDIPSTYRTPSFSVILRIIIMGCFVLCKMPIPTGRYLVFHDPCITRRFAPAPMVGFLVGEHYHHVYVHALLIVIPTGFILRLVR